MENEEFAIFNLEAKQIIYVMNYVQIIKIH